MTKPIPDGYRSVTLSLTLKDTKKAIEFYQKAFSAKVVDSFPNPSGRGIMHAVLKVGDTLLMMGDEMPGGGSCPSAETMGGSPISLYLYVPNADEAFKQAAAAGGQAVMPVADMFWGDRAGTIRDPFGYQWMIATHTKDLTPDQVNQGAKEFFVQMSKK